MLIGAVALQGGPRRNEENGKHDEHDQAGSGVETDLGERFAHECSISTRMKCLVDLYSTEPISECQVS